MIRLVELVLLTLVLALNSGCNGHSVNNQSDLNHQLNKRFNQTEQKLADVANILENLKSKLNNATNTTVSSSELSESNQNIKYMEEQVTELKTHVEYIQRFNQMDLKLAELINMLENLNSKLDNHSCQTEPSSELSKHNSKMDILGTQIKELRVKIENLNGNQKETVEPLPVSCLGCRNVTVLGRTFEVLYENNDYGNDWIVIQHRFDGKTDFYRNWKEYRNGFGSLNGEFWLGLENIHVLTSSKNHELLILLEDFNGVKKYARYGKFAIGGESEGYNMTTLGTYSGTAGDSLKYHKGQKFSTFDRDQGQHSTAECAELCNGAWWYKSCAYSNLNGLHKARESYRVNDSSWREMFWYHFKYNLKSLKTSKMMIRAV